MKHSSTHRSRTIAALAGLLLVTSLTSARAAALDDETRAIAGSPLAVSIEGPAGERRRLVHVPHRGWQLIEGRGGAVRREAALIHPTIAPDQAAPDADVHSPLTVLIDGPTGSAFVWRQDEGWRFVGRVAAGEQ